jgi:hypothetical protein
MPRPWTVLPHKPIAHLEPNLWEVEGTLEGIPMNRRMVLLRRPDGTVLVHNAIAADEATMREIDAWGRIATIVVPSGDHRLDAHAFHVRYPDAKVVCPALSAAKVRDVLPVDGDYGTIPAGDDLRVETLDGAKSGEAVFVVTSPGQRVTLIFNDAIFNLPHQPGFKGLILRTLGSSGGPRITPFFRFAISSDTAALRAHVGRLASIEGLRRFIPAHGDMIEDDPAGVLRAIAAG